MIWVVVYETYSNEENENENAVVCIHPDMQTGSGNHFHKSLGVAFQMLLTVYRVYRTCLPYQDAQYVNAQALEKPGVGHKKDM